jgi:hypothetical protein
MNAFESYVIRQLTTADSLRPVWLCSYSQDPDAPEPLLLEEWGARVVAWAVVEYQPRVDPFGGEVELDHERTVIYPVIVQDGHMTVCDDGYNRVDNDCGLCETFDEFLVAWREERRSYFAVQAAANAKALAAK